MEILNHGIGRICSINTNLGNQLLHTSPPFNNNLSHILKLSLELENKKEETLDNLHTLNLSIKDKDINNGIQNIRRSIYNDKSIKPGDLKKTADYSDAYAGYLALKEIYEKELSLFRSEFDTEIKDKRDVIKVLLDNPLLQNGFLISSDSLISSIDKYVPEVTVNKKNRQREIGYLKYLTRSIYKPTPFSSLTQLNRVSFKKQDAIIVSTPSSEEVTSFIRINNAIFQILRNYFVRIEEIYESLRISLNPSLVVDNEEGKCKILINKNNFEYFHSFDNNGVVNFIINFCNENPDIVYSELVKVCIENIAADEDSIKKYVKKLFNIGLIELDYFASGTDIDWIEKLLQEFPNIADSEPKTVVIHLLTVLNDCKNRYQENFGNINERKQILDEAYQALKQSVFLLRQASPKSEMDQEKVSETFEDFKFLFKKEKIFLEDTSLKNDITLNKDFFEDKLKDMTDLVLISDNFSNVKKRRNELFAFFSKNYDQNEVNLLNFYEDYYRFLKENSNENQNALNMLTPAVDGSKIIDSFDYYFNDEKKVFIEAKQKIKTNKNLSLSMFFQVAGNNIIVNSSGWGYGRMSSRFLYMFDKEFYGDVVKQNNKLEKDDLIYSEVNDSSFFNANLHPPLFPFECIIPGGHKNVDQKHQIKVSDLLVRKNEENQELELFSPVFNKKIYVHDSCFQGVKGRSQLFNLLLNFSDKVTPSYGYLITELNKKYKVLLSETVEMFPRMTYSENFILQRQHWIINEKETAELNGFCDKDDHEFLVHFAKWAKKFNIPSEFFIILNISRSKDKNFAPDDYKPQYINIYNPVFISFIKKLLSKAKTVRISEVLPKSEDAVEMKKDNNYISEFLIQWYDGESYRK